LELNPDAAPDLTLGIMSERSIRTLASPHFSNRFCRSLLTTSTRKEEFVMRETGARLHPA
jgi:hypothetical protein